MKTNNQFAHLTDAQLNEALFGVSGQPTYRPTVTAAPTSEVRPYWNNPQARRKEWRDLSDAELNDALFG